MSKSPSNIKQLDINRVLILATNPALRQFVQDFRLVTKSPEDDTFVKDLVSCSIRDLKASKTLFGSSDFPNAIYHLQQSVEKLTKAYAVRLSVLTKEEAIGVSHYSPKMYFLMLSRRWTRPLVEITKSVYQNFDDKPYRNLKQTMRECNSLPKRIELARMSRREIDSMLSVATTIRSSFGSLDATVKESVTVLKGNITTVKELMSEIAGKKVSTKDVTKGIEKFCSEERDFTSWGNFMILYILSAITFCHESFTRYPDHEFGPSDYQTDLGIVDAIQSIWSELEQLFPLIE